jgi:hypothetical protein
MSSTSVSSPASRKLYWAGWVLTVLPAPLLVMSAFMKISQAPKAVEGFEKYGYAASILVPLGITELVCLALYLFPRTAYLGAILLTGYLGGAVDTHVRASEPFFIPIVMGAVVWLGLLLRDPRLRDLLPLTR